MPMSTTSYRSADDDSLSHPIQHPSNSPTNPFVSLPPGWSTSIDPRDGRIFYWHAGTGKSSWTHPSASRPIPYEPIHPSPGYLAPPSLSNYIYHETPRDAAVRPDNHQCQAIVALLLFPPLGIIALYHSCKVDYSWKRQEYSDAFMHARQAPQFASFSICLGIIFWIYIIFFADPRQREWLQFNTPWNDWWKGYSF